MLPLLLLTLQQAAVASETSIPLAPPPCVMFNHTDFSGNDLPGNSCSVKATSPADCCSKCSATAGCKAWTFMQSSGTCCFKRSARGHKTPGYATSYVSGCISKCDVPVPPPPGPPPPPGVWGPPGQAGGEFRPGWNAKARTPPLGWRSWNVFGPNINAEIIKQQIDALTDRKWTIQGKLMSVQDLGFSSVGIDEGWELCHNVSGQIQRNGTSQPSGSGGPVIPWSQGINHYPNGTPTVNNKFNGKLKSLVEYGHSKNVSMGFYYNGCACANWGHRRKGTPNVQDYIGDIALLHDFGFDGVKFDNCGGQRNLTLYASLMKATGRNFTIENCHWGECSPTDASSCPSKEWAPFSFFRTSSDINSDQLSWFENLQSVIKTQSWDAPLAGPHIWSNPDMLEVGRVGSTTGGGRVPVPGWSLNQTHQTWAWNRAHFGGWCIVSAPLILGLHLEKEVTDDLLDIVGNEEAIAINQAWAGHPGSLLFNISSDGMTQVWAKPQPQNKVAVLFINALNTPVNTTVTLAELNLTASACSVRDVWRRKELGRVGAEVATQIGPTDSQFLLLTPVTQQLH